jgi:hypothetical protein
MLGFQHLYINIFESASKFALIEGGHMGDNVAYEGISWALVKNYNWENQGYQWRVNPIQCENLTSCLRKKTYIYNQAQVSYHFLYGPNSNSFIWWVLNACQIHIIPKYHHFPFTGIDYYQRHTTWQSNFSFLTNLSIQ